MIRKCVFVLTAIGLCMGSACPQNNSNDNGLVPKQWSQLQADEQGDGFNAVHTNYAVAYLRKWARNTAGDIGYSSPVVSLQNTIWVGTLNQNLIGYDANGYEIHRKTTAGPIIATPAVDQDGRVYFIYLHTNTVTGAKQSDLGVYDPVSDSISNAYQNPMPPTTASPKIWGDYVFVATTDSVFVFHRFTLELIANVNISPLVCGEFDPPEWLQAVGWVIACPGTLFISGILGLADCIEFTPGMLSNITVQPSVSIVDNANIVDDPSKPMVLFGDGYTLYAFTFDPSAGTIQGRLQDRWHQVLVPEDCDHFNGRLHFTTPAVVDANQVVIGDQDGFVSSFDLATGNPLWLHIPDGTEPVQAPPVSSLRQIYVVTQTSLKVLDSNGTLISKTPFAGSGGGAALSLDYVYVMTTAGLLTFPLDPTTGPALDAEYFDGTHIGFTTPAIAQDGTIYVTSPNGVIEAFENRSLGGISIPHLIPQVAWLAPHDGELISTSAGQTLRVALGNGSGFTGDISITSSLDGALCQFHVDGVNDATCTSDIKLTQGAQILTASATDASGATQSVQINVTVVANQLSVKITSPADGAVLFSTESNLFSASVFDPDEEIPDANVHWTSSIDGDLGSGRSIGLEALTNGEHTITCTATDSHAHQASESISVLVTAPIP